MASDSAASSPVELSVVVVTYNHVRYIEQALESVATQQTARSMEIIVSEDDSTDGTRDLVTAFAGREPRARLMLSSRNLHTNEVVRRGIDAARGRYVCVLDGDDHWTSPTKLERQAALLDVRPDLSACFHNASVVRSDGQLGERWTSPTQASLVDGDEIWLGNPFATCTGMMRKSALEGLGGWYDAFFPITDWPLYVLCAEHGDLGFTDEVVGAYRLHDGALFSTLPGREKLDAIASFYSRMDEALGFRRHDCAQAGASHFFFGLAEAFAAEGDRRMARSCLARSLRSGDIGRFVGRRKWARTAWRTR